MDDSPKILASRDLDPIVGTFDNSATRADPSWSLDAKRIGGQGGLAVLQVIQPIDGQQTEVASVPAPRCGPGQVLIANRASLISAGTEKSTVDLARQSLLQKARQRPDHVRRVVEKIRSEGLASTIQQVRAKLGQPMPLGYSSAGIVLEVGEGVTEFAPGDRVASNGPHAGIVAVGKNLVAPIPEDVPFDQAAYAVVASIALQGVRLANVGLGDVVAVVGLGLIGQITVALLKSAGCKVVGADINSSKLALAERMGSDFAGDMDAAARHLRLVSPSGGADAVIITASTTSNGPMEWSAEVARDRAKIVAVGAVGLHVPRREFYHKELELVVSRSYGPGRYDARYEEAGIDYPISYVRWTEQRNIQAVLELMSAGRLPVKELTTHRFSIEEAENAYAMIEQSSQPYLGVILTYDDTTPTSRVEISTFHRATPSDKIGLSVIGAGNFASATLVPAFVRAKRFTNRGLVSAKGLTALSLARSLGFHFASSSLDDVLEDKESDAVVLATRHHLHVPQGLRVLESGRHLFLEKPLAISIDQLEEWTEGLEQMPGPIPIWMVGFNRRFSPPARLLRDHLASIDDVKLVAIRFNAGAIPQEHWVHDPEIGGGRLVGEACHAIDLATYLIGSPAARVFAQSVNPPAKGIGLGDNAAITLHHRDGSVSNILYTSSGDRSSGKERVEVHAGGTTAVIDDYRSVEIHRAGRRVSRRRWWSQEKGFAEEIVAFAEGIRQGVMPIPANDMIGVTLTSLRAVQSMRMEIPLEV